jgi:hypothetical protein
LDDNDNDNPAGDGGNAVCGREGSADAMRVLESNNGDNQKRATTTTELKV